MADRCAQEVGVMDLPTLKHNIMHNELDNFYIFTGVETQVQRVYIDKISEINGKPVKYIDRVLDLYGKSNSLFVAQNYTYVCIEDRDFLSNEKAWDTITKVIGNNALILWYTTIDKRGKAYKRFTDIICDFDYMSAEVLKKYVKKAIRLSDDNCELLMQYCNYDYSRCLLEIDKINQYAERIGDTDNIDNIFTDLLNQGLIYKPISDVIFELSNAVIEHKCGRSIRLLHEYELSDGVPLKAITVLYGAFKKTFQVKVCTTNDIATETGLSDKEIYQINKHIDAYTDGELLRAMQILRNIEIKFKQGLIDEEYMLPYAIMNIL